MLRAWARTGWKRGRLWKAIERWGRLAAAAPVSTGIPAGATMICDLQDEIQRLIFFLGVYEAPEAYVFTCLLKPGLTVIDGGANVGQYTLLASHRVGPGGSVHAFQPIPRSFEILRRHAAQAANVVLNQTALWNSDDGVTLTLPTQHRMNCGGWTVGKAAPTDRCVQVPSVTLDSYLASGRIDRVDAIKLDIEGTEPFALQGAMRALKRFLPIILMEVNHDTLARVGITPSALGAQLYALGYRSWKVGNSAGTSGPVTDLDSLGMRSNFSYRRSASPR